MNAVEICGACRQRTMSPVTLDRYSTQLEHDGRKYQIEVPNFRVQRCQNCGQIELDDTASDQLFDSLRSAAGLLSSEDILTNRRRLGLKQKELADLLQISESTLSRWETGAQLQQRAMDRYLRTIFEVKEAREHWGYTEPAPFSPYHQFENPLSATTDIRVEAFPLDSRSAWPTEPES